MVSLDRNNHSVGQSAYHLVFRPKYNVCVFRHPWVKRVCEDAFKEIANKYGVMIYEMQVMPDHVHMFIAVPPKLSLSKVFQLIKGASSRKIMQKCTRWKAFFSYDGTKKPHLWSRGKFYRSVGNVRADVIEHYIASSNRWDFDYLNKTQTTLEHY
jgi:putative transposase